MAYLDNKALIEIARKHNQYLFAESDDEQVYNYIVKNMNPEELSGVKGSEFAPWEGERTVTPEPFDYKRYTPRMIDKTTQLSENPKEWYQYITDMSIPGFVGEVTDWNYLKYAAMQGSTDLLKAAMSGESSYQLKNNDGKVISPEEYAADLNMLEEVLAWGVGQFNAPDIGIWLFTAGVGNYARGGGQLIKTSTGAMKRVAPISKAQKLKQSYTGVPREKIKNFSDWDKGVSRMNMSDEAIALTKKEYFDGVVRNSANRLRANNNRYSNYLAEALEAAPSAATSLGAFSMATGTIHSLNEQRMSVRDPNDNSIGIGDISLEKTLWDGTKSGFEGMVLGSLIAGVNPATTRIFGKMATKFEKSESPLGQGIRSVLKSPLSVLATDVGIEGTLFNFAPYAWKGLPKDEDGNIDTDTMMHQWAHSVATIGMLKGSFKAYEKIITEWKGEVDLDKASRIDGESRTSEGQTAKEVIKNIQETLKGTFSPTEIQKITSDIMKEEFGNLVREVDGVQLEVKEKIIEKWENNQDLVKKIINNEKLTEAESATLVQDLAPLNRILSQMDFKKIATPEAIDKYLSKYVEPIFKQKNERTWTPEEKQAEINKFTKKIKSRVKELDNVANKMNDLSEVSSKKLLERETREKELQTEANDLMEIFKSLDKKDPRLIEVEKEIDRYDKRKKELTDKGEELNLEDFADSVKKVREILESKSPKERIEDATRKIKVELAKKEVYEDIIKDATVKDTEQTAKNLEKVLEDIESKKADSSELNKDIKSYKKEDYKLKLQTEKTKQDLRIDGRKTVDEHINDSTLSAENKAMAKLGIDKFVRDTPGILGSKPYKLLTEFFEYLQSKNVNINKADTTQYKKFLHSKGLKEGSVAADPYRNVISAFYGGQRSGTTRAGFSDSYMKGFNVAGKKIGKKIKTTDPDRGVIEAGPESAKFINYIKSKFVSPVKSVARRVIRGVSEVMFYTGRRAEEVLSKTEVRHLDIKNGTISLYSAKTGDRTIFNWKEMHPESFAKLVKLAEGKKSTDLLFTKKDGVNLSPDYYKTIMRKVVKDANVDVSYSGNVSQFSPAKHFRDTIANIAKQFGVAKGDPTIGKMFGKVLAGRKMSTEEAHYFRTRFKELYPEFLEFRKTGEVKETPQERQTLPPGEKVGPAATAKEKARVIRILKKKYPEITLKLDEAVLRDAKGKIITSDRVLETVVGTLVKVKRGAPIESAVHGAIHPILKTLDAISKANPNTKLGKTTAGLVREMYTRARKHPRFKYWRDEYIKEGMSPKDATNRAAEEVIAEITGKYVAGRVMDKSMFQRVKDWFQRTYTALKTSFKDVDKMSEKELTQLFGERFLKRKGIDSIVFETASGSRMEFMTITKDNTKDFKKHIDDTMTRLKLDVDTTSRDNFVAVLARDAGITRTDFSLRDITFDEVIALSKIIGKLNIKKLKEKTDVIKTLEIKHDVDRNREKTNITMKEQVDWLKNEGVKNGDIMLAPYSKVQEWNALLYEYRVDPKALSQIGDNLASIETSVDIQKRIGSSIYAKLKHAAAKGLTGFHQFAKHLGLTNLASWTLAHITSEQGHAGRFTHFNDTLAPEILGVKKWKKVRKIFTLLEANEKGEFIRLNDKTADPKEVAKAKLFIKKGFDVEIRDGKWYNKGINWDPKNQQGSEAGRVLYYFKHSLMNELPKKLDNIALSKFTKAKYESIMKSNDIKFLNQTNEAFYIPRRTSRVFQENFNLNALKDAKAVSKAAREIAYDMAKDANSKKWDKLTKEEKAKLADEFSDTARVIANAELQMLGTFGAQKIQFNHLIKRNRIKLDEYMDIGGEKIKVWETDFEASVMPFAAGWSKFLANVEHAPWALKLRGLKTDVNMEKTLLDIEAGMGFGAKKMESIKTILQKGIERRVGTHSEDIIYSSVHDFARDYTSTLMRLQLAGPIPMSGIKNYFTQAIQMVHTFTLKDVIDTHFKAMSSKERAITEMMGATSSIGITGYKPKTQILERATDLVFKSGFMPWTESFARTWARLAADVDGRRLSDMIQKDSKNSKTYKYSKTRLKEIYELTDAQINLLERHGFDPLYNKMSAFDRNVVKMQMDGIYNQIQIVGNMKTAGATVDAMMPEIGNKKWMKPFLMYKRIAYATTVNNMSMMKYNWNNGHVMRSAMMMGGTLISGGARMWLLKNVLGQTLPGENSDWAKAFQVTLWQGEFLGILSELWSPYAGTWGHLSNDMLFTSALTTHAWKSAVLLDSLGGHYSGLWETSTTPGTALHEWSKSTSASYNNIYKVMSQRVNKYNGAYKTIRQWKNDFEEKHNYWEDPNTVTSESKKYFRDLKTAFNLGNMNELNEATTLAYYGYASDRVTAGASQKQAFKEARSMVERTLTNLNPVVGSFDRKGYYITPAKGFIKSLSPEQKKLVKKIYDEYNQRVSAFLKQYPHYLRKQNQKDIKENFKFTIKPQYDKVLK